MFTHKVTLLTLLLIATFAIADESPQLGEEVTDEQITALSFTILPNGQGLPAGSGNALKGESLYQSNCLSCHGTAGQDGVNDRLVGGQGSIHSKVPVQTVGSYWPYATTVFDYIRRAMPYQAPGSLSDNDTYSLTAYLLYLNGIVDKDTEINMLSLPLVKMPNRDNFIWAVSPK